jgi:hypothetical protein
MESQLDSRPDLQRLLARQSEIQRAMRRPGGIRITVERELHAIREQLKEFAGAGGAGARTPHAPRP